MANILAWGLAQNLSPYWKTIRLRFKLHETLVFISCVQSSFIDKYNWITEFVRDYRKPGNTEDISKGNLLLE